jgi:hypothetical protein
VSKALQTLAELLPGWLEFTPRREEVDREISRMRGNETLLAGRLAGQRDTDPPEELRWTKDFQERMTHESSLREQLEARQREYEEATGRLQEAGRTICRYARQNNIDPTPLKWLLEVADPTAAPAARLVLSDVMDALGVAAQHAPVAPVETACGAGGGTPPPVLQPVGGSDSAGSLPNKVEQPKPDQLARFGDPTRCPDPECGAPVPELCRLQSSYVCNRCGRWRLHTGILAMQVSGPPGARAEYFKASEPLWRALEQVPPAAVPPAPPGALAIRTPTEIAAAVLAEVLAVREKLRAVTAAASRGPHGGRGPLGVPAPITAEEGLAWLQSPPDGRFLLPHLYPYFEAVRLAGLACAPRWRCEPQNELEALDMLDDIEKCCRAALNCPPPPPAPAGGEPRRGEPPDEGRPPSPTRHSKDFRSVHWFGTLYCFTEAQASIVAALWEAWANDTPDVGHRTLLAAANLNGDRLPDVFKEKGQPHPAWGTMIRSGVGSKGTARLCPPEDAVP